MFNQKLVKDDRSDYIIYHPCPFQKAPPLGYLSGEMIPETGCQCVSIDPAIKHFAIRVENRLPNGNVVPLYFNKVDFSKYENSAERSGTSTVSPEILKSASSLISGILELLKESRLIVIERQMAINVKSSKIFQHVLSTLLVHVNNFNHPCVITDVSPKLKGTVLGAPKKITQNELKKWGVDTALEILEKRGDDFSSKVILHHKGRTKTKGDDLADTIIQLEALVATWGGMTLIVPESLPAKIEIVSE